MQYIIIKHANNQIKISKAQALKLELAINLLPNKKYWIELGDLLYNFHSKDKCNDIPIEISEKKFNIIKEILRTCDR